MRSKLIKSKSNYFSEKDMIEGVKEYQRKRDRESFKKIEPSILALINGMIQKQFSYNHHIKNNKSDAVSECFIEILKSLERYDPERGRLYAYLNRIAKNTLMKYYRQSRKIKDKEQSYTDVTRNIDDDNVDNDNVIMTSGLKHLNLYVDDLYNSSVNLKLKPSHKNVTLSVSDTLNIIYKYLCDIRNIIHYYVDNEAVINKLIEDIDYQVDIDFDFTNSYNKILISKKMFYKTLICNLYEFIHTIITYIENKYKNYIDKDEVHITYDGKLSNRAIGYVRKIIKTKLKRDNLARYYNVDDLINFIKYLIRKRYEYDE